MNEDESLFEPVDEVEQERPHPADEPLGVEKSQDLFRVMRDTITRLEKDQPARGDLKILSYASRIALRILYLSTLPQTAKANHLWFREDAGRPS